MARMLQKIFPFCIVHAWLLIVQMLTFSILLIQLVFPFFALRPNFSNQIWLNHNFFKFSISISSILQFDRLTLDAWYHFQLSFSALHLINFWLFHIPVMNPSIFSLDKLCAFIDFLQLYRECRYFYCLISCC